MTAYLKIRMSGFDLVACTSTEDDNGDGDDEPAGDSTEDDDPAARRVAEQRRPEFDRMINFEPASFRAVAVQMGQLMEEQPGEQEFIMVNNGASPKNEAP